MDVIHVKNAENNNSTDIDKYSTKSSGSTCSTMTITSKSSIADVQLEWEADMINGLSLINPTRTMLITSKSASVDVYLEWVACV